MTENLLLQKGEIPDILWLLFFAINLARKIAINPRRNDLSEIKTSLIRFYKQYHFLRFIRNALEKHESFFWEIFSDAFLNETNIQPTDGELKQYFDASQTVPSVLYTRMIDALEDSQREERNSLRKLIFVFRKSH